jgi:hypothetical protein
MPVYIFPMNTNNLLVLLSGTDSCDTLLQHLFIISTVGA